MKTIINNLIAMGILVWVIVIDFIMMVVSYIGWLPLYPLKYLLKNHTPSKRWEITEKLNRIGVWLDNQIIAKR